MSKILIAFIVTYLGGIGAAIFVEASWGVYLYQLQYFINPVARWWYSYLPELRYSFIIAVCLLFAYIIRYQQYSANRISDLPQTKWLLSLTIIMFLVGFIAVWPERHWDFFQNHLKLVGFLFVAYKVIDTPLKFERMIWAFLIGEFYVGWVAHGTGRDAFNRLEGVGPADSMDANDIGAVLVSSIPFLIFYLFYGKRWQKFASFIFLAYIMDGLILTNSRGAFIGLAGSAVYLFYFMLLKVKLEPRQKTKLIATGICGVLLFFYLTDTAFWTRMGTLKEVGSAEEAEVVGAGRTFFWFKTFDLARQHPFGTGAWGYQYLSPEFIPERYLTGGRRAEHSTYFEALAELGYPGLFVFLGYLVSNLRLLRTIRATLALNANDYIYLQAVALSSGFLAYLLAAAFINRLWAEPMYWFPLFIACFYNIYVQKNHAVAMEPYSQEEHPKDLLEAIVFPRHTGSW